MVLFAACTFAVFTLCFGRDPRAVCALSSLSRSVTHVLLPSFCCSCTRNHYDKPHTPHRTESHPLNMDITGHFESASCVIEVDRSATLAQVKGKLVAELGVPRARHVGVRMRGGGDIGNDDLRICDTEMDEGCAVELYYTGANITPGVIPSEDTEEAHSLFSLTLSPCDRYLAVIWTGSVEGLSIFDTATHEHLCHFPCHYACNPSFSPCSEWISCGTKDAECAEVHDVKTGALKHSFGDEGDERLAAAWSPCGTKLLSCCRNKGLQVWDIATGVVVHEWSHIVEYDNVMVVTGDRVAMSGNHSLNNVTIWDYTTGVEVLVLTCPADVRYNYLFAADVDYLALSPNQRFIAACYNKSVRVWNIETGECVFEDDSEIRCFNVAVSNDVVAAYSYESLSVWSISTCQILLHRDLEYCDSFGLAMSSCGGVVMYGRDEGVEIVDISHLS